MLTEMLPVPMQVVINIIEFLTYSMTILIFPVEQLWVPTDMLEVNLSVPKWMHKLPLGIWQVSIEMVRAYLGSTRNAFNVKK